MKHVVLAITVLFTGCIPVHDDIIVHSDVVQVGASDCYFVADAEDDSNTAQAQVGIMRDCVPRRKLVDYKDALPTGYRVIFLSLGPNDVAYDTPLDQFRAKYEDLVYNSDAEIVYCVLPNRKILGHDGEPYRQIIIETCVNVVDPLDYGVKYRARDGVHLNKIDHAYWAVAILELIDE